MHIRMQPLRRMQNWNTEFAAWERSENRYAGKSMIHKLEAMNKLLNEKYRGTTDRGDHVVRLVSKFSRLEAMGSPIEESIKVANLLFSLADQKEFAPIVAFVYTLREEMATWSYITRILIEEYRRLNNRTNPTYYGSSHEEDRGHLASMSSGWERAWSWPLHRAEITS